MEANPKSIMEKQSYRFIGNHSAIKICEWTKKSLIDKGFCYKQKFYGIKSHRCCQISPWIACSNRCVHCWRPIELELSFDKKTIDNPKEIIDECIRLQKKLLIGFKGNYKTNRKKYQEAQEPMQFAISLIGEPSLYPKIGELIIELRKRKKTSFLVTNGLQTKVLQRLGENRQLPTQLYLSMNSPNKEMYDMWHKSNKKDAWKKFNETLKLFPKLKTRKVIRMTLVKDLNDKDEHIKEYSELIKKAKPDFLEIKSYMAIGFSRQRLGYEKMLSHKEIKNFAKKLAEELNAQKSRKDFWRLQNLHFEGNNYKILDEHKLSRVVLIGKDKEKMRIVRKNV